MKKLSGFQLRPAHLKTVLSFICWNHAHQHGARFVLKSFFVLESCLHSDMQVVHVSEIPDLLDVLMMERHTVSLHLRRGVLFQQFQIIAKARVWKDQAVTSFS